MDYSKIEGERVIGSHKISCSCKNKLEKETEAIIVITEEVRRYHTPHQPIFIKPAMKVICPRYEGESCDISDDNSKKWESCFPEYQLKKQQG